MMLLKYHVFAAKLFACLLCFGVFFYFTPAETWAELLRLNWRILPLLVLALIAIMFALPSLRLYLLLRPQLGSLTFAPIFYSAFVSYFAGTFMPLTVAGDVARFFWLDRRLVDADKSRLLSGMILDRVLNFFVNVLLFAGLAVWMARELPLDVEVLRAAAPLLAALVLALVVGIVLFARALRKRAFIADLLQALKSYSGHPARLAVCVFISAAVFALTFACILYPAIWAVEVDLPWDAVFFVVLAASLLSLIPIAPGGLGFMEMSQAGMLTFFSCPAAQAAQIVILLRCVSLLASVPGGVLLFWAKKHKRSQ
ncbi:MAG: flippase-like domain-containing protein [Desulfovibrionaceae bacterium]|nr:flippase-like domain-containing protein [Desulfovibrionaceae bacterium]